MGTDTGVSFFSEKKVVQNVSELCTPELYVVRKVSTSRISEVMERSLLQSVLTEMADEM